MLGDFHFARPLWLLLVPLAAALPFAWRRRTDERRRYEGLIAPHLLDALLIGARGRSRVRPVDTAALLLGLAAIATAGPTWRREPPPFAREQAAPVVAIDLSPSMDATDVAPTRLERAVHKVHDLAAARAGARIGLIVYAGTAHLVLPPTDDPALLGLYLDALSTDLMPVAGRAADAALALGDDLLASDAVPGTIVFVSDGVDAAIVDAFGKRARASRNQVLVLAVGTPEGGPLRGPDGGVRSDASGRPLSGTF